VSGARLPARSLARFSNPFPPSSCRACFKLVASYGQRVDPLRLHLARTFSQACAQTRSYLAVEHSSLFRFLKKKCCRTFQICQTLSTWV
jgi:hypothetical protein